MVSGARAAELISLAAPPSAEPGDLDGDGEMLRGRAGVDAGQRPHVGVVATAGQQDVPAAHVGEAGRVDRDPVTGPELHPGVALAGGRDRFAELLAASRYVPAVGRGRAVSTVDVASTTSRTSLCDARTGPAYR